MSDARRKAELLRLRALAQRSAGKIRLLAAHGTPLHTVQLELHYRTALTAEYPKTAIDRTELTLALMDNYPHIPPTATIRPRVFNPHVFSSGLICLGSTWNRHRRARPGRGAGHQDYHPAAGSDVQRFTGRPRRLELV